MKYAEWIQSKILCENLRTCKYFPFNPLSVLKNVTSSLKITQPLDVGTHSAINYISMVDFCFTLLGYLNALDMSNVRFPYKISPANQEISIWNISRKPRDFSDRKKLSWNMTEAWVFFDRKTQSEMAASLALQPVKSFVIYFRHPRRGL